MDRTNNNDPTITSCDPFDYDPISLDDELLQLITSVISPTSNNSKDDNNNVVALISPENQPRDQNVTPLVNNDSIDGNPQGKLTEPPKQKAKKKADEEGKKKTNAIEMERKRRQVMSSLYQDLRSLLPAEFIKKKRSTSDLLQVATNYINHLEEGIKGLNDRKTKLSTIVRSNESSMTSSNNNINSFNDHLLKYHVTIKPCKHGFIEVIIGNNADYVNNKDEDSQKILPLSKVLNILTEEGLDVVNCVTSRIDDNLVHTIQTQVDDGRNVDLGLLRQTLSLTDHH
nr:hypothetical protein [Suaeda aralocaspica]